MTPRRSILLPLLWAAAVLPAVAAGRYPITPGEIAATITSSGLPVSASEVAPLADVVASVAQPALLVKSIERTQDHRLIARIECAHPGQCLPFLVAVDTGGANSSLAATALAADKPPAKPPAILVRAGSSAILLLEGPHVHISLSVICLENGTMGQLVRAASPDRHQFYTVQVVGDRILRGNL